MVILLIDHSGLLAAEVAWREIQDFLFLYHDAFSRIVFNVFQDVDLKV